MHNKTKKQLEQLYPECDKLLQQSNTWQTLNDFIEWLYDQGYSVKHYERKTSANRETIVYDFMQVDKTKIEDERRKMLASLK